MVRTEPMFIEDKDLGLGLKVSDIHFTMYVKTLGQEVYVSLHDSGAHKLRDRGITDKIITPSVLAKLPRAVRREITKKVDKQLKRFNKDLLSGRTEII